MDGVMNITKRIDDAAAAEIAKIRADADAEIAKIRADSDARVAAIRADSEAAVAQENAEADTRAASAAETAKRAVTLACRAEVLDGVYKTVRARLAGLSGDERVAFLSGVLHAALAECHAREAHAKATFGENIAPKAYVLRLAAADLPLGEALIRDCGEPVTLGGEADIDGGLLLECGDTFINCSLDMILRDAREQTEPHIRTVLFG